MQSILQNEYKCEDTVSKKCKYSEMSQFPQSGHTDDQEYFYGTTKQDLVKKIKGFLKDKLDVEITPKLINREKVGDKYSFTFSFSIIDLRTKPESRF